VAEPGTVNEVVEYVRAHPGMSATELSHALRRHAASLSSLLVKLVHQGTLQRQSGVGPRGGWGYYHPKPPRVVRKGPSVWVRLARGVDTDL
jgi:predicted transcriptional regulator